MNCLGNFMKFNKFCPEVTWCCCIFNLKICILFHKQLVVVLHLRISLRLSLRLLEFSVLHNGLVITQILGTVIGGLMLLLEKMLKLRSWTLIWNLILGAIMTNWKLKVSTRWLTIIQTIMVAFNFDNLYHLWSSLQMIVGRLEMFS